MSKRQDIVFKDFHFSYYEQSAFYQKETPFSGTNKETLIKGYKIAEKFNLALLAHFVKNYNIRTPQDNFYGKNSGTRHKIFSAALPDTVLTLNF